MLLIHFLVYLSYYFLSASATALKLKSTELNYPIPHNYTNSVVKINNKDSNIFTNDKYENFYIKNDRFLLNDKEIQIFSGSFHYFRLVEEYWPTRLDSMLAMGLNSVTFYVAWNFHETVKDVYDFSSKGKNLRYFLQLIKDRGMLAIIRPSAYICAEWEFGGHPAWLINDKPVRLRTFVSPYIDYVTRWMTRLYKEIAPYTIDNGGPIVLCQIENEYGSFGDVSRYENDRKYIQHLIDLTKAQLGDKVIRFTTDYSSIAGFKKGSLQGDDVITMGDGCENGTAAWAAQKLWNPKGKSPFLCTETYTGWISHYGEQFSRVSTDAIVNLVSQILEVNNGTGSVSLYMAFGGSNIGYWAGANANDNDPYQSDLQSYDYNAPIAESGEHGFGSDGKDKFTSLRDLFQKYTANNFKEPTLPIRQSFGKIHFTHSIDFWASIDVLSYTIVPNQTTTKNMEQYQCYYGFIAYVGTLGKDLEQQFLTISKFKDVAFVFLNDVYVGKLDRNQRDGKILLRDAKMGSTIKILVQNMGRANFDTIMQEELKGIEGRVYINDRTFDLILDSDGWTVHCTNFENHEYRNHWKPLQRITNLNDRHQPTLYKGIVQAKKGVDTWIDLEGWSKGLLIVNNVNLGYYWLEAGPQETIFVPGPYLKNGENEIVLFEISEISQTLTLESINHAKFGY